MSVQPFSKPIETGSIFTESMETNGDGGPFTCFYIVDPGSFISYIAGRHAGPLKYFRGIKNRLDILPNLI
jgi:hypothetical protein